MREILFRGKRKADGAWIVGHLVSNNYGTWLVNYCDIVGRFEYQEVIPETVGQFTGLLDKNGKEFYEGDLFKIGIEKEIFEVRFEHGCFLAYSNDKQVGLLGELSNIFTEIIGNIHNNPELIKQGGAK